MILRGRREGQGTCARGGAGRHSRNCLAELACRLRDGQNKGFGRAERMPVGRGHVDSQRLRAVRHRAAESRGGRIEMQPGRQRRPIGKGRRVGQRPPVRVDEGVGGKRKVHLATRAALRSSLIGHHRRRRRRGLYREGFRGGEPAGIGRRHHDAQDGGVVRNHAGKSQARSVELQPGRQRRPVREIRSVGQRLALGVSEGVRRQRKVYRLSLLPRLGRRLRADDRALCHKIDGKFPPIYPIRAVEGAHGNGVGSGQATGLQAQVREIGGADGDRIGGRVRERVGAVDQKTVISCTTGSDVVELVFSDGLAGQGIAGDEQRREL